MDRLDRSACHEGKRTAKCGIPTRSIRYSATRLITGGLQAATLHRRAMAEYLIYRTKYLQNYLFHSMRSVCRRVLLRLRLESIVLFSLGHTPMLEDLKASSKGIEA